MKRRGLLLGSTAGVALSGCKPKPRELKARFVGTSPEAGHKLRSPIQAGPAAERRSKVVIVGAGIAGLAAGYTLMRRGITDFVVLDLEAQAGGNSRGGRHSADSAHAAPLRYPLGAHYLPTPAKSAIAVRSLLQDFGLLSKKNGLDVYPEGVLCHSPQERLLINGTWQEGLLPQSDGASDYARFEELVLEAARLDDYLMPNTAAPLGARQRELDQLSMAQFLERKGLRDPKLIWYLDYCCHDDYGAGLQSVSALAGIAYFASRHGFSQAKRGDSSGVLTWPEGNAWLGEKLAARLSGKLQLQRLVHQVEHVNNGVRVHALDLNGSVAETWHAHEVLLCTPCFVSARLLGQPSTLGAALREVTAVARYAAWQVANVFTDEPLKELAGAPRSWDNVIYGSPNLGYVDSQHQSFRAHTDGPTVLTHYSALGIDEAARKAFYSRGANEAATQVLQELAAAHPNIAHATREVQITRYGHAMISPTPGLRSGAALARLQALALKPARDAARVRLAHSDLSGYSVFEEAFTWGHDAAVALSAHLGGGS